MNVEKHISRHGNDYAISYFNDDCEYHREDGPAWIYFSSNDPPFIVKWDLHDIDITKEVEKWIKENNYPEWKNDESWDDNIKLHFKLAFVR